MSPTPVHHTYYLPSDHPPGLRVMQYTRKLTLLAKGRLFLLIANNRFVEHLRLTFQREPQCKHMQAHASPAIRP